MATKELEVKYKGESILLPFELNQSISLDDLRALAVQAVGELEHYKERMKLTYEDSEEDTVIITYDKFGIERWITNMQGRTPYFVCELELSKKRVNSEVLKSGKRFCKNISDLQFSGGMATYRELPTFHLLHDTSHPLFPLDKPTITLMHRKVTQKMQDFITSSPPGGLYIHGPHGVGKSYSLYEVVCNLQSDPSSRVIYIPDCGDWGKGSVERGIKLLIDAIVLAFPNDWEIIAKCENFEPENPNEIEAFLVDLPKYCKAKGLKLYAVFDQHNELSPTQRQIFPYLLAEITLPASHQWKQNNAVVVLSASPTNGNMLNISNKWPMFTMSKGFNEDELKAWFKQEKFFPSLADKSAAAYWTNSMPQELTYLLRIACENSGISGDLTAFDRIVSMYIAQRTIDYNELQTRFEKEHCQAPVDMKAHLNTVARMEHGGEGYCGGMACLLNQQFMFIDNGVVKPTTPLVQQFLIDRYKLLTNSC